MKNNITESKPYVGRFAPSPTGNLHLGSLLAALASYFQARANNGIWLIRIEDLDPPRVIEGSAKSIINTLKKFGLVSDMPIIKQSQPDRQRAYQTALSQLNNANLIYQCTCTRKQLSQQKTYPGTCLKKKTLPQKPYSLRVQVNKKTYHLNDKVQGYYAEKLTETCGDFNVVRKDGLISYQLAVVVDDAEQKITEVVRGVDILDSTPRQLYLIETLQYPQPEYVHIPIIIGHDGHKLSKQTFAKEIHLEDPYQLTLLCLQLLGHNPPSFTQKKLNLLMRWAESNWDVDLIPKTKQIKPCKINLFT